MKVEKAFNNWKHNAIHLTFPNGNKLSTIWGYCSYSDNYDLDNIIDITEKFTTFLDSDTVEIMILKAPNKIIKKIQKKFDTDDMVIGSLSMSDWLWVVKQLSN